MTCKHLLLVIALAGCVEDVPVLELKAKASKPVSISVPVDSPPDDAVTYDWRVSIAPDGSRAGDPLAGLATMFTPDLRGDYLIDRWVVADVSERLSYHVVLSVSGVEPMAAILGATSAPAGTSIILDGSQSESPERLGLSYRWRLAVTPAGSHAVLGDVSSEKVSLVPDVAGEYHIELMVFDGSLWSVDPATAVVFGL
ncbi:MAG TPA: hypothetical protein VGM39_20690 [Kofleriaceae bacterium]|jgi:hypothetical protein